MDLIATLRFRAERPDGEELDIKLGIGRPYELGREWRCNVSVEGLDDEHDEPGCPVGVSSWQALIMALAAARTELLVFIEDGGKLEDMHTGTIIQTAVQVDACFGIGGQTLRSCAISRQATLIDRSAVGPAVPRGLRGLAVSGCSWHGHLDGDSRADLKLMILTPGGPADADRVRSFIGR